MKVELINTIQLVELINTIQLVHTPAITFIKNLHEYPSVNKVNSIKQELVT